MTVGAGLAEELAALDGVVVATSTSTHPAFALQIARAGLPSLVEKPLALDPGQLTALADELDDIGTEVMVAFHRRYDPGHQLLRQRILDGDAGTVRAVTATGHDHFALSPDYVPGSGGIWLDMLIHDFDTIPWVTGQRVRSVWATGSVLDAPVHAEYGDVDSAVAVLVLESGAAATVSGLRRNGAGQDARLEVFGTLNSFGAGIDARTPMTSTEPGVESARPSLRPVHRPVRTRLPRRSRRVRPARLRNGRQPHARRATDSWPSESPRRPPSRSAPAPPSTSTDRPTDRSPDMSDKVKIGLIGTGRIGQVHAASIAALPETTLRWVCDPFVESAKATAQKYEGAQVTTDPTEVLDSGDVDAIIVASPTPTHVDLISAAIDAGVPVLCEKPIDLDIARVDALREKARAATVPVVLGFNRRFDPHFAELHRRVARGDIGPLEQLTITSRDPGTGARRPTSGTRAGSSAT